MTDYRKLFDLNGKTAVVLGAASGIGKSSAEALANLGAQVLCADRDRERVEATVAGIRAAGGRADAIATDAALPGDVSSLAEAAKAHFSRVDIAVTTPGLNIRKTILDYTEEDLDRVLNLNIKGTVYFFQAFGRIMMDQGAGQSDRLFFGARGHDRAGPRGSTAPPRPRSSSWSRALRRRSAALACASTRSLQALLRRR